MARLVYVVASPHDPTLPATVSQGEKAPEALGRVKGNFERVHDHLADARPDVILVASGDHFNQFFYDNMPTFAVGVAESTRGPAEHEVEVFGLSRYRVDVQSDFARYLLHRGLDGGFDFSWTNDFLIDHGFTVPLEHIRPEADIPIVPLFTNVLVPPVASGTRFYDLGRFIAQAVAEYPDDIRVAVIGSGHMTNAVGGPLMTRFRDQPASDWDLQTWDRLMRGAVEELVPECTWERLYREGNGTPGFLINLLAWGAAGGRIPAWGDLIASHFGPACAFIEWTEETLEKED